MEINVSDKPFHLKSMETYKTCYDFSKELGELTKQFREFEKQRIDPLIERINQLEDRLISVQGTIEINTHDVNMSLEAAYQRICKLEDEKLKVTTPLETLAVCSHNRPIEDDPCPLCAMKEEEKEKSLDEKYSDALFRMANETKQSIVDNYEKKQAEQKKKGLNFIGAFILMRQGKKLRYNRLKEDGYVYLEEGFFKYSDDNGYIIHYRIDEKDLLAEDWMVVDG